MRALVLTAPGVLELADVPEPEAADDELLVRVEAVGICGSDVHGMGGGSGRRVPPLVMGHEAVGVVEAVGASVRGWLPGQAVTFDSTVWCGSCATCLAGRTNLCERRRILGVSTGDWRRDGAFAERIAVPARIAHPIPDGLSTAEAALTEPLAVVLHAVARARGADEDPVLVIGAGVIGLLLVAALHAAGRRRILVVDLLPGRLMRARELGATHTIEGGRPDVPARIAALTDGRGPAVVFEAVGMDATVDLAIGTVAPAGTVVLVGNLAPSVGLPLQSVVSRQVTLAGTAASSGEYPVALELLASRRVDARSLISAVAPLEEGAAWFARLRAPDTDLLKVVLRP